MERWKLLDDTYAAGEFRLELLGSTQLRCFAAVREALREGRDSAGRGSHISHSEMATAETAPTGGYPTLCSIARGSGQEARSAFQS